MENVIRRYFYYRRYSDHGRWKEQVEYFENKDKNIYSKFYVDTSSDPLHISPFFFSDEKEYIRKILDDFHDFMVDLIDKKIYFEYHDINDKYIFISFLAEYKEGYKDKYRIYLEKTDLPKELEHILNTIKALIELNNYKGDKRAIYPIDSSYAL